MDSRETEPNKLNPLDVLDEVANVNPSHRNEKFVASRHVSGTLLFCVCKQVELENGGTLSVQASASHYCSPRNNTGPYTSVEVGFPTGMELPDSWKSHADYWDRGEEGKTWRDSDVFGHVPVEMVRELILENCPKLRAALERAEGSLVKDLDASDRKDWFNKKMR